MIEGAGILKIHLQRDKELIKLMNAIRNADSASIDDLDQDSEEAPKGFVLFVCIVILFTALPLRRLTLELDALSPLGNRGQPK